MLEPLECEIILSPEELKIFLNSDERTTRIVVMLKDHMPISIDPDHDKDEIISWIKDIWEESTIIILVP
jgi:hypothetical protein